MEFLNFYSPEMNNLIWSRDARIHTIYVQILIKSGTSVQLYSLN